MSSREINADNESEAGILTQEEVDEQIRNYIAPLTIQLEEFIRFIQGMSTAHRLNLSPRAGTSASFSAAGPAPKRGVNQQDRTEEIQLMFRAIY